MKTPIRNKAYYQEPQVTVFDVNLENAILALSGDGADLTGAGVDETEAENNGNLIW